MVCDGVYFFIFVVKARLFDLVAGDGEIVLLQFFGRLSMGFGHGGVEVFFIGLGLEMLERLILVDEGGAREEGVSFETVGFGVVHQ